MSGNFLQYCYQEKSAIFECYDKYYDFGNIYFSTECNISENHNTVTQIFTNIASKRSQTTQWSDF